jgi:phosphate transport system substrate-binding protein
MIVPAILASIPILILACFSLAVVVAAPALVLIFFLAYIKKRWFYQKFLKMAGAGTLPRYFLVRYLPFYFPMIYTLLTMYVSSYIGYVADNLMIVYNVAFFSHLHYAAWMIPIIINNLFAGNSVFYFPFIAPLIVEFVAAIVCMKLISKIPATPTIGKRFGATVLILLFFAPTALFARFYFNNYDKVLPRDDEVVKVHEKPENKYHDSSRDEPDFTPYRPFGKENNKLVVVRKPTFQIRENHPRIGGALAMYPVYAAAVQALYENVDEKWCDLHVVAGTSPETFKRLTSGDADLVFMAKPSEEQFAEAKRQGKTLHLTPMGRDAFVFFTNAANPINNLTVEQIQDIYARKITNWKELGGGDKRILPFQRPDGSGSQTAMRRIMQDKPLTKPIREEYQQLMGGIVNRVADYRNYPNSIGYSFRYFATSMFYNEGIKLISINGVAPTVENISNGAYPFASEFYIVTSDNPSEETQRFVDWFLSPQGQQLVEQTGYVPLKANNAGF